MYFSDVPSSMICLTLDLITRYLHALAQLQEYLYWKLTMFSGSHCVFTTAPIEVAFGYRRDWLLVGQAST